MGSQTAQAHLWGQRPKDWASTQEPTGNAGYEFALDFIKPGPADTLLDIGCGSGLFASLAARSGAAITGLDATPELIEEAKQRNTPVTFLTGEMEELPFAYESFTVVSGFNSFQYAANVTGALTEAKRVLQKNGKLVAMIWGNKEDCEAASYLKAIGSLLPPPPPGAPGPFALTEDHRLENILRELELKILVSNDVDAVWHYADIDIALKGLLSAGPAARAIENAGFEKVDETLRQAVQPFIQKDGSVVYKNKFRVVIAEKSM